MGDQLSDDPTDAILGRQGTTYDSSFATADINGSIIQMLLAINSAISATTQLFKSKAGPASLEVDDEGHYQVSLIDKDTGAIAQADITAGTYDIDRVRAGATTNIVSGAVPSKADGKVYEDYTFVSASWDEGDLAVISFTGIEATIGSDTYHVEDMIFLTRVSQETDIETKIDALQTDVGDFSALASLQSLLAVLGGSSFDTDNEDLYDKIWTGSTASGLTPSATGSLAEMILFAVENTLNRNGDSGTYTASGGEDTIFEDTDTEPWIFMGGSIDLSNMAAGDTIVIKINIKNTSGGSYTQVSNDDIWTFSDDQTIDMVEFGKRVNVYGMQITLEQTAGTNRDYEVEWFDVS